MCVHSVGLSLSLCAHSYGHMGGLRLTSGCLPYYPYTLFFEIRFLLNDGTQCLVRQALALGPSCFCSPMLGYRCMLPWLIFTWLVGSELRSSTCAASPLLTDSSPQFLLFRLFLRWNATELARLDLNSVCSPDRLWTYDPPASDSRIAVMQACVSRPGFKLIFDSSALSLFLLMTGILTPLGLPRVLSTKPDTVNV